MTTPLIKFDAPIGYLVFGEMNHEGLWPLLVKANQDIYWLDKDEMIRLRNILNEQLEGLGS